jgi:signal transduction histidine kinase
MSHRAEILLVAPEPEALRLALAPMEGSHVLVALPSVQELLPRASRGGVDVVVLDAAAARDAGAVVKALDAARVMVVALAGAGTAGALWETGATVLPSDVRPAQLLAVVRRKAAEADARAQGEEELRAVTSLMQGLQVQVRAMRDREAAMAHELRTPLAIARGFATNLLDGIDGPLEEQQRDSVLTIVRATDQLLGLLERPGTATATGLASAPPGTLDLRERRRSVRTDVDLGELVEDVVWQFGTAATQAGLRLRVEVEPGLPRAWLDPGRMTQVVSNLLSNALKYTPRGGSVVVAVHSPRASGLSPGAARGELRITVRDDGPGIPTNERERVWERYHHVPGTGSAGQGIGLAVVREIVTSHSGRAWVEDAPEGGAAFVVSLPRDLRGRRIARRVLVLDDVEGLRSLLLALREAAGAEGVAIRGIAGGEEAAEAVLRGEAGVVLAPSATLEGLAGWLHALEAASGGGGSQ